MKSVIVVLLVLMMVMTSSCLAADRKSLIVKKPEKRLLISDVRDGKNSVKPALYEDDGNSDLTDQHHSIPRPEFNNGGNGGNGG
ncbi:hypothetical protein O6P43_000350 [Quillaja saponaria]|uniref:Uncharacterized protein n=1 Tax=Quillaja saponaria TaxID=32244 RepID=A0AAD7VMM7_QUISA|nr:hypothetical protein O6P43_000350 [Quillaja saponaria]